MASAVHASSSCFSAPQASDATTRSATKIAITEPASASERGACATRFTASPRRCARSAVSDANSSRAGILRPTAGMTSVVRTVAVSASSASAPETALTRTVSEGVSRISLGRSCFTLASVRYASDGVDSSATHVVNRSAEIQMAKSTV